MHSFSAGFNEDLFRCILDPSFPDTNVLNAMRSALIAHRDRDIADVFLDWLRRFRPHLAYTLGCDIVELLGGPNPNGYGDANDETKTFRLA